MRHINAELTGQVNINGTGYDIVAVVRLPDTSGQPPFRHMLVGQGPHKELMYGIAIPAGRGEWQFRYWRHVVDIPTALALFGMEFQLETEPAVPAQMTASA